jgi:toxin ParE1/3/4
MVQVVITELADADIEQIYSYIASEAGEASAEKYDRLFDDLFERLADHPESCQTRPRLGAAIRAGIVYPYIVIYRFHPEDNTVRIFRVVHGRRKLTRKLLRGD